MRSMWRSILVVSVMLVVAAAAMWSSWNRIASSATDNQAESSRAAPNHDSTSREYFPVSINRPAGPPAIHTGLLDFNGAPVTIACSTCHSMRMPNVQTRSADALDEFHQGLIYNHGSLTCLSCHNPGNYDTLRLADQSEVQFTDVMTLCAQCHGTQFRDYQHGAHGGMEGYWDLSKGPRTRNNCIDCHDPHAPAFPMMMPTFKPKDRFLEPAEKGGRHE